MGAPIARRLARSGFSVVACDISPSALQAFDQPDTTRESDPLAAARRAKRVGICVRTDAMSKQYAQERSG